jgi:hypothetical protein
MFTLGKNTYMLQGVGDQMNNKSFGKSMIKSIVGTGKYINVGQKAKYTLVPDKLTTGTISSIGLKKDVSEKYIAYSNKKARLPFEPAVEEVEVVQPEVMQETQVETTPEIIEDALAKVEISSNAKGLAAALTNPTELAKSKGNLSQSYPIYYQWLNNEGEAEDGNFKDVEEAYQELKDNREAKTKPSKEDSKNYRLMVELITAKLQQHPRLATEITKAGGSKWIMNATHQPTKQNTVWETGGQNWFILALNDAYAKVTSAPVEVEQTDTANEMVGALDGTSMFEAMFAQMQEQAVEIPSTIEPGQYVKYLNETFIVTQINNNGTIQVYNPTLEGPASKRSVSSANLTPIAGKATFVNYRNAEYMVTPKNTIISMTTNKAMEWAENDGNRKAIVEIAKKVNANALDIKNLNMTAAVLDTLYLQSSKRMTKNAFDKAVTEMVINMRATTTPENILEKIKCL